MGGRGSSLTPARRRVATETYWAIRRSSPNVRGYLSLYYPGDKTGRTFQDLWLVGEMIDIECEMAYRRDGMTGLALALERSDVLEHCLSRIGAEVALHLHKDPKMYQGLLTSRPPGSSDLLPDWAISAARDLSKAAYQEQQRVKGRAMAVDSDDEEPGQTGSHRRRRAKAKAKAAAGKSAS